MHLKKFQEKRNFRKKKEADTGCHFQNNFGSTIKTAIFSEERFTLFKAESCGTDSLIWITLGSD